jgi:hypothetical protein
MMGDEAMLKAEVPSKDMVVCIMIHALPYCIEIGDKLIKNPGESLDDKILNKPTAVITFVCMITHVLLYSTVTGEEAMTTAEVPGDEIFDCVMLRMLLCVISIPSVMRSAGKLL